MKMPWGKHRGMDLADVPEDYLRWALEHAEVMGPVLREAIRQRLGLPTESASNNQIVATVRDCLKVIYRELSLRYHPDRGGSHAAMIAVNHMHERLQEELSRRLPRSKE
jgi:hypothetical protein